MDRTIDQVSTDLERLDRTLGNLASYNKRFLNTIEQLPDQPAQENCEAEALENILTSVQEINELQQRQAQQIRSVAAAAGGASQAGSQSGSQGQTPVPSTENLTNLRGVQQPSTVEFGFGAPGVAPASMRMETNIDDNESTMSYEPVDVNKQWPREPAREPAREPVRDPARDPAREPGKYSQPQQGQQPPAQQPPPPPADKGARRARKDSGSDVSDLDTNLSSDMEGEISDANYSLPPPPPPPVVCPIASFIP